MTIGAPPVAIRQRFFADFSTRSALPSGLSAVTASTWRENSRTRYEPGVQTAIDNSTLSRPDVGHLGAHVHVVRVGRGKTQCVADRIH